jgi:hypothetical protein
MSGITVKIEFSCDEMITDVKEFVGKREVVFIERSNIGICVLVTDGYDEEFKEFKCGKYIRIK